MANKFLLVLSTELIFVMPVASGAAGGLSLGFAMHLVTDHFRVKVEQSIDPVCVRVLVVRTVRVF